MVDGDPAASVIIRVRDGARTIHDALSALRDQDAPVEIVVVDSGSTDGTLEIARRHADVVLQMRPEDFTYGRALNVGATAATGEVHFALSAHCVPPHERWVSETLSHYSDPRVAATNGAVYTPGGWWLHGVHHQTPADVWADPMWGFSNHASSWRASVWRELPFREDLLACEDKEWSWRVLADGWTIAYDPRLSVPSSHRRRQGLRALYRRVHLESQVLRGLDALPPTRMRELIAQWWSSFPIPSDKPRLVRRLGPHRTTELLAQYAGVRRAAPLPGGLPTVLAAPDADPASGPQEVAHRTGRPAGP